MAQRDIFLQIDGIDGETKDVKKTGQIELESVELSGANSGSPTQAAKTRVSLTPVNLTKKMDKSSPNFFANLCNNQTFKAVITARKSGGEPLDYFKLELKSCIVSSYRLEIGADGQPLEHISLTYGQIQFSYWPQDAKGILGAVNQKSYNLSTNVIV